MCVKVRHADEDSLKSVDPRASSLYGHLEMFRICLVMKED